MVLKKIPTIIVTAMVILVVLVTSLGVTVFASEDVPPYGYQVPAPDSGNGIDDGSGFDGEVGAGRGPAPNSGDGIPDGSGF